MRVHGIDRYGLGLGALVNHIAGSRLDLFRHNSSHNTGNANLTFIVRGIEAVAAQVAVVGVHIAAVGIGQLELSAGDKIAGYAVFLLNHQRTGPLVPKRQLLDFTALNENILGRSVQHKALHGLDLSGNHRSSGLNAFQDDFTGFIREIHPIVRADSGTGAVHHLEAHAAQRLVFGSLDEFPNY